MNKLIYCLEKDKDKLIREGFKLLHTQELGDKLYYVFEDNKIKNNKFDTNKLIHSNKMFF